MAEPANFANYSTTPCCFRHGVCTIIILRTGCGSTMYRGHAQLSCCLRSHCSKYCRGSACLPAFAVRLKLCTSSVAGLACVWRHTLGVSYPDRCLHAVPAAQNFCTSRRVSGSNPVCPPSTAKELVSLQSITLPETCDIWGKHHHSSGQPFFRALQP